MTAKLRIDGEKIDPISGRVLGLTEALNEALPPAIRVFSATVVNKRFNPRLSCVVREYEYYFPQSFFRKCVESGADDDQEASEAQVELALERFQALLRQYEGSNDFANFTTAASSASSSDTSRIIYRSECLATRVTLVDSARDNETYIRYRVSGNGFLYHQIRLMLGAALLTACQVVPDFYFHAALSTCVC